MGLCLNTRNSGSGVATAFLGQALSGFLD